MLHLISEQLAKLIWYCHATASQLDIKFSLLMVGTFRATACVSYFVSALQQESTHTSGSEEIPVDDPEDFQSMGKPPSLIPGTKVYTSP